MHNYKELLVWKKSITMVKEVYKLTCSFPEAEKFGLTSQMRRSAVSIPSNIAEGCGRLTNKQTSYFFEIALGSSCELETQLINSNELNFIQQELFNRLNEDLLEVQKMTRGFISKVLKTECNESKI